MTKPESYRVLITGSRDWKNLDVVRDALVQARYGSESMVVVHGACRSGADAIASWWVKQYKHLGITEEPHPAAWRVNGRRDLGAGYRRNADMVKLGADVCVACIGLCDKDRCPDRGLHGSHGTTHAALLADDAGIPVVAYAVKPGTDEIVWLRSASGTPRLKAQLDELYGRVAS